VQGYKHTTISFIIPVEDSDNKFVIGAGLKVVLIRWDGRSQEAQPELILGEVDLSKPDNRFNDAKADRKGRLWLGTMGPEDKTDVFVNKTGTFYRFDNMQNFVGIKMDIGISNGMAWNERAGKFYYIDSTSYDIKKFDYNEETGALSNERVLVNLKAEYDPLDFVADGMTIDTDGNLYVATFFGNRILKINPSGKIEKEIQIPTSQVRKKLQF
jgi:pyruvate kinase